MIREPKSPTCAHAQKLAWWLPMNLVAADVRRLTFSALRFIVPMPAQSERGLPRIQRLPGSCRGEAADRDRSPVAARGPRRHPGKITDALLLARPLRAGTARGPNLIGSWSH